MLSLSSAADFCKSHGPSDELSDLVNAICFGEAGDFRGAADISFCELEASYDPGNVKRLRRDLREVVVKEKKRLQMTMTEDLLHGLAIGSCGVIVG